MFRLKCRAGDALQFLRESALRVAEIHAQTDDYIVHHPVFAVHAGFGQNAADLPPVHQDIVDPLDARFPA